MSNRAQDISDAHWEAFLDEALAADEMAALEQRLREQPELSARLAELIARRELRGHSLGAVWRRHRLSCPSRVQLGSYLLTTLTESELRYIAFHVDELGCRACSANLADLRARHSTAEEPAPPRRQRYFESSAHLLSRKTEHRD